VKRKSKRYIVVPLGFDYIFPNPRYAPKEGLLAYGGDLDPNRIIAAYKRGIFPWFNEGDPILWWSPDPRLVLYPKELKVSKSFRRVLRNREYKVVFDANFKEVIYNCAKIKRKGQRGTWLIEPMQEAYIELFKRGFAHSVEVYEKDELIGGLYGLALGRAFFGESMFSLKKDASKIALKALSDVLASRGYDFIDCQVPTDHLQRMGAKLISRDQFLDELEEALKKESDLGSWHNFRWEYKDERDK